MAPRARCMSDALRCFVVFHRHQQPAVSTLGQLDIAAHRGDRTTEPGQGAGVSTSACNSSALSRAVIQTRPASKPAFRSACLNCRLGASDTAGSASSVAVGLAAGVVGVGTLVIGDLVEGQEVRRPRCGTPHSSTTAAHWRAMQGCLSPTTARCMPGQMLGITSVCTSMHRQSADDRPRPRQRRPNWPVTMVGGKLFLQFEAHRKGIFQCFRPMKCLRFCNGLRWS